MGKIVANQRKATSKQDGNSVEPEQITKLHGWHLRLLDSSGLQKPGSYYLFSSSTGLKLSFSLGYTYPSLQLSSVNLQLSWNLQHPEISTEAFPSTLWLCDAWLHIQWAFRPALWRI